MSNYCFVQNGTELPYSTRAVDVQKTITVDVKEALWKGVGQRLTVEELQAIGVQLKHYPTQTPARLQYEHVIALYTAVPEFAVRVSEWKSMFDYLGVYYDATVAEIAAAEEAKFGEHSAERADFHDSFMGKRTEVLVNYQAAEKIVSGDESVSIDDYTIWTTTATLVKWLPGTYEQSEIPAQRFPVIVTSTEHEQQLEREDAEIIQAAASAN